MGAVKFLGRTCVELVSSCSSHIFVYSLVVLCAVYCTLAFCTLNCVVLSFCLIPSFEHAKRKAQSAHKQTQTHTNTKCDRFIKWMHVLGGRLVSRQMRSVYHRMSLSIMRNDPLIRYVCKVCQHLFYMWILDLVVRTVLYRETKFYQYRWRRRCIDNVVMTH